MPLEVISWALMEQTKVSLSPSIHFFFLNKNRAAAKAGYPLWENKSKNCYLMEFFHMNLSLLQI